MASESKDYSQGGEQLIITKYFGTRSGRFLDIGAYDGVMCSNTHALALAGWDGVCVEANPGIFARLMQTYHNNHNIALLNAFVGLTTGITQFFCADLVSSNSLEHLQQFHVKPTQSIYVPTIELTAIKDNFSNGFNFINIDVEGGSVELFKHALMLFEPELICVEHEHNQSDCTAFASSNNYSLVYSGGINMIFTANTKTA